MRPCIYLDNNATTRPLDEVVEAMLPFLRDRYGNPSSVHRAGQAVRHEVEHARARVAALIGARPDQIVFTSGGTESINLALCGAARAYESSAAAGAPTDPPTRIVTTTVEHRAVLSVVAHLERAGYVIARVPVDADGRPDEDRYEASLRDGAAVVSISAANNETGIIADVARLTARAARRGIPVHVDAVQAVGKTPVDVGAWGADLVSVSAHKFHGPKGVGALFVREPSAIEPLIIGGGQERGLRGGTENVPGIVGMGAAATAAVRDAARTAPRVAALRDALEDGLRRAVPGARVIGAGSARLGNTTHILFPGVEAEPLLILLSEEGVCASSGSACASGSIEPSHVLLAMGHTRVEARCAIRLSLSRMTTDDEIRRVVSLMPELIARVGSRAATRRPPGTGSPRAPRAD